MAGGYEGIKIVTTWADAKYEPRSKMETLVLFRLEGGKASFSLAYPSLSSSLRRCSASIRRLRAVSFLMLARCSAWETSIVGSSSELEELRLRRREVLGREGVGLYLMAVTPSLPSSRVITAGRTKPAELWWARYWCISDEEKASSQLGQLAKRPAALQDR